MQQNQLQMARVKLERRNVRAPFDGMIVSVEQETGEWVETGTKMMRIIDLQTLEVEGFIEASRAQQGLTGKPVTIELSGKYEEVSRERNGYICEPRNRFGESASSNSSGVQ